MGNVRPSPIADRRSELLAREFGAGTSVTNCVAHMRSSLLERPADCHLCTADMRNTLRRAIRVNEFLNQWKEDASALLRESL